MDPEKGTVRQPFIIGSVETSSIWTRHDIRSGRFEWAIKFMLQMHSNYNLLTTALEKNGQPMEKDVDTTIFALVDMVRKKLST